MAERHVPRSGTARGMDRRALLQAAGLGAGVLAAGGLAAGRAAAAAATAPLAPLSGDLPLTGGPDFPIGLFWPPHPFQTTLARYQEITDAGFTFLITGNYQFDERSAAYALGIADQVGLKVLVAGDPRMQAIAHYMTVSDDRTVSSSITTADAVSWVGASLAAYAGHPSLAGFNIYDEPVQSRFPTVGALTGIVRGLAPTLLPYSNLSRGNGASYAAFVQRYIDTVRPALLSFDRYPILTDGIDLAYFDTWAIIRNASLTSGLPAWTYIQSTGFNGHRVPTASQLAWQVNVSLAYGCKGIQYFTYWTPDPARGEGYTQALVTLDGERTPLYDAAKALNRDWLQPVGRQLKPLVSESVQHAEDEPLPTGAVAFAPGAHLTSAVGDAVVLALFKSPQDDGTRYLLVANRDPDEAATTLLGFNSAQVKGVAAFAPTVGTYLAMGAQATLKVDVEAGAAALFRLSPN